MEFDKPAKYPLYQIINFRSMILRDQLETMVSIRDDLKEFHFFRIEEVNLIRNIQYKLAHLRKEANSEKIKINK